MARWKTTSLMALLLALLLVLAACAADDDDAAADDDADDGDAAEATDEEWDVWALLPQGNDQPYGTTYLPPMEETAEELGINLTITNSEYDAETQLAECETAVAAAPDAIILWPAVGDTVRPCLESAQAAGIPVTVTNSDVNPDDKDLTIGYSGPDTYGQGAASAELMCEAMPEGGILMVNGLTGNSTAINRREGFVDTIEEECPGVEILDEQPGDWGAAESKTVTAEMLTAVGPENVDGIYAADDTMAAGAIDALEDRGIDPGDLVVTSIGNTFLGNPLVQEGKLYGTVFQSSSWDGENAVRLVYRVLIGEDVEPNTFMPQAKVTAENADDPAVAPEW